MLIELITSHYNKERGIVSHLDFCRKKIKFFRWFGIQMQESSESVLIYDTRQLAPFGSFFIID